MFAPLKLMPRALRRFARKQDGAVALEFGFVAVPFFMLTFGLAEVSLMGLAQTKPSTWVLGFCPMDLNFSSKRWSNSG